MPLVMQCEVSRELFCDNCGVYYPGFQNYAVGGKPDNCFCSEECALEYIEGESE